MTFIRSFVLLTVDTIYINNRTGSKDLELT